MIRFVPPQAAALAAVAILILIGLTAGRLASLAVAAAGVLAGVAVMTAGIIRTHARRLRNGRKVKA